MAILTDEYHQAQSHVHRRELDSAIIKLTAIVDSIPETPLGRDAQHSLAMIYVSHNNPNPDYYNAMHEFGTFIARYPDDPRIEDARAWVRLLSLYTSTMSELGTTINKMNRIQESDAKERRKRLLNVESLAEIMKSCYEDRDSLSRLNQELKRVIIEMERKHLKK